jgi:hypothetical protein
VTWYHDPEDFSLLANVEGGGRREFVPLALAGAVRRRRSRSLLQQVRYNDPHLCMFLGQDPVPFETDRHLAA